MAAEKETVLLLGASGSMGFEAFKELWSRVNESGERKYDVVLLLRPSKKNKKKFARYEQECEISETPGKGCVEGNGLRIVYGDATEYHDMLDAVRGVDWILSPMAFIAPAADHDPDTSKAVNTTAVQYIIKAIYEVGGQDHIKLVYVGSVAETGDRLQEIHMGRVGDPLKPSIFDFYATCKIEGERAVIESGLKYWVSLRQTFIAIPDTMSLQDPIMFHQPLDTCIELNTSRDAGRGLVNCLDVPEESDFWRRVYNMGGGPDCRVTYYEMMRDTYKNLGLGDFREIMDRNWFTLRNFHCQYFEDSHILNEYIHNWGDTLEDFYHQLQDNAPREVKVAKGLMKVPGLRGTVKSATRKRLEEMVDGKDGTRYWYESGNSPRINAFYGSMEAYEAIGDWDEFDESVLNSEWKQLDHGYDETKSILDLSDLGGAAEFRGGQLISPTWNGEMYSKIKWKCAFGHEFEASPFLVLKTGHWCPECAPPAWNYDEVAKKNPFFAQVWYTNHSEDESNYYDADCYKDIL
ncbi:MAG: NAD-dependent epimerase/dehydratase family protein [Candidatus Thorarchaeota archaeon]|jgi:nucleoside-diphosphate-sugar epimerase